MMVQGGDVPPNERMTDDQARLTGSKLETATTAPTMATSTTPPDTMLSRKFLSDGVSPDCAASATSGSTSAAAAAAAVSPAAAFSFMDADARTAILAAGLALGCRGWNDAAAAPSGFLSPATGSGDATADRDAVAMAQEGRRD
jgi:hypothetical protein